MLLLLLSGLEATRGRTPFPWAAAFSSPASSSGSAPRVTNQRTHVGSKDTQSKDLLNTFIVNVGNEGTEKFDVFGDNVTCSD